MCEYDGLKKSKLVKRTETVDDEGDEFGDSSNADSDAGQQLAVFLNESIVVEDGTHVTRHRQLTVQHVARAWRYTVCNQPNADQLLPPLSAVDIMYRFY